MKSESHVTVPVVPVSVADDGVRVDTITGPPKKFLPELADMTPFEKILKSCAFALKLPTNKPTLATPGVPPGKRSTGGVARNTVQPKFVGEEILLKFPLKQETIRPPWSPAASLLNWP